MPPKHFAVAPKRDCDGWSVFPQYVGTIPPVLGYAIICNSILALIIALLVSGWPVLVPFAEESWCREHLGAAYEEYTAKTPRFFGLRGLRDRKAP